MSDFSSTTVGTAIGPGQPEGGTSFDPSISLEAIRRAMFAFAAERQWEQFHTPRNLVLALMGEVGELAEIFQWRGECPPGLADWNDADRVHLGEELSDVLLYLVRLSDRCGVDLAAAACRKMERNRQKYPVEKVKGRSDKYTAYQECKAEARAGGAVKVGDVDARTSLGSSQPRAHPVSQCPPCCDMTARVGPIVAAVASVAAFGAFAFFLGARLSRGRHL